MRPISVKFKCFGPYRQEMTVDFTELEKKGLFLICGETGAGKTTILDAICYALYGRSSGGLRGDLSVMRCKMAEPSEETYVEFIFEANKKQYCFSRSLRYGRKNLNDEHNCKVWKEGTFVPIFENPGIKNVNQKAEEILGLSYDQFRQVIILPQGQFEKLLVSDSAEKEKILVSLFRAEKWQLIADEFYEKIAEEDKKLKAEYQVIASKLADYECKDLEELGTLRQKERTWLEELNCSFQQSKDSAGEKKHIYEEALRLGEQFQELDRRKKALEKLEQETEEMGRLRVTLQKSDEADEIKAVYEQYCQAEDRRKQSEKQVRDSEEKLQLERNHFAQVREKKEELERRRPSYEKGIRQALQLENGRENYQALAKKTEELEAAKIVYERQKILAEQEEKRFQKSHDDWIRQMELEKEKIRIYTDAQTRYLSGISGVLAEKLVEGEPCPVCGSMEHPDPARQGNQKITEKELERLQQEMQQATEKTVKAGQLRTEAEARWKECAEKMSEAKQNVVGCEVAYQEALSGKIDGIKTVEELELKLTELRTQISKYEDLEIRLQNSINEGQARVQTAEQLLAQKGEENRVQQEEYERRAQVWTETLQNSIFLDAQEFKNSILSANDKNNKKNKLIGFESNYKVSRESVFEQETLLEGKIRPELFKIRQEMEAAEQVQKDLEKQRILKEQYVTVLETTLQNLKQRKEIYDELRLKTDENLEFANRLRGRSGISLQRYVLGVMLSSITIEANRLLRNVHHGRYQLYRTDAISGSGRKGGLELEVLDTQNHERRSVTTLSGGEKFLVALSLAIGLSTVVQAQGKGMKLGAMFIDEGFGSLDKDSIYDALEVLQGIQKANGLVGIISHVELLREVIPSKIEVKKRKEGSWF